MTASSASDTDQHLAVEQVGAGDRLVLVHGFTQNRRCWGPVRDDLARDHELVLVDAPGHGESAAVVTDFAGGAALIGHAGGSATYLGYSMGGRYCLRLALDHPKLVKRLVLVGATAGIDDTADREQRRLDDRLLACRLEEIGLPAFIDEWLAGPLFAGLAQPVRFVRERLDNDPKGLATSLLRAGTGEQEPLWDRLAELEVPVLLAVGALDRKFTDIADRMAASIGANARVIVIPGAGHTAHLEQPDAFLSALRAWLRANPLP